MEKIPENQRVQLCFNINDSTYERAHYNKLIS